MNLRYILALLVLMGTLFLVRQGFLRPSGNLSGDGEQVAVCNPTHLINERKSPEAHRRDVKKDVTPEPEAVQLIVGRASDLLSAGKQTDAEKELVQALKQDPGNSRLRMHLGEFYLGVKGDSARASQELEQAYAADPRNLRAFNGLMDSLRAGGDLEKAVASLEDLTQRVPKELEPRLALSDALLDTQRPGAALQALASLGESGDPQVHERRAEAYQRLGQYDQASQELGQASALVDPLLKRAQEENRPAGKILSEKRDWEIGRAVNLAQSGKLSSAMDLLISLRDEMGLEPQTFNEIKDAIMQDSNQ